jgi:hypothetical protein
VGGETLAKRCTKLGVGARIRSVLFVLLDEPDVFVFRSATVAEREIEPIDAESEIRAAFDESGIPYGARWVRPNRRSSLLGIESLEQGEYRLLPVAPPQPAALVALLVAHPNEREIAEAGLDTAALVARLRWSVGELEVTRRIAVTPTASHRRGEVFGKRKIPYLEAGNV